MSTRQNKTDVLITGAHGTVGSAIKDHLGDRSEYDFTYFDLRESPNDSEETVIADIREYNSIRPAFENQDAVIHLARVPGLSAWSHEISCSETLQEDLGAICNVMEATLDAGVEKFVYASSNHAVGMYEVLNEPDIYYPDFDLKLDHTTEPRPDSLYGLTKIYGEGIGRLAADAAGLKFAAIRICSIREPEYDHPYGDAEKGVKKGEWERGSQEYDQKVARHKAMWQSRRDFAQMVDLCLQNDDFEYEIFSGVSGNDRRWFSIERAREVLGYDPQDNGDEWDSPPDGSG